MYEGWKEDYEELLESLREALPGNVKNLSFELITHRFTARAKKRILEVFPRTTLPMDENERQFKYGQFGYGKYVYPKEKMEEISNFFNDRVKKIFPGAEIKYLV